MYAGRDHVQPDVRRDQRAANLLAERLQEDEEKPVVPPWSCRALDSPGQAIVHFEEGPGASDKVSDNGSRHRQTQHDVPRHRYPSGLR